MRLNPCNVTLNYLRALDLVISSKSQGLYFDISVSIDELKRQAIHNAVPDETRRLRAFFCFELMYGKYLSHRLIVGQAIKHGVLDEILDLSAHQSPRTWMGITGVLNTLDAIEREYLIQAAERELSKTATNSRNKLDQLLSGEATKQTLDRVPICKQAAEILRRELKDPIIELGRVGSLLSDFLEATAVPSYERVAIGKHLLTIYPGNALSPWNMTPESPP